MSAYNEIYVDGAMEKLGEAVDYACTCCDVSLVDFMDFFVTSGVADEFGDGSPRLVAGMSGTELTREVLRKTYDYEPAHEFPPAQIAYDYSEQYWVGWILAYYQWSRGYSFRTILEYIPAGDILCLYHPLHEASEERAARAFDERLFEKTRVNELQRRRRLLGYTQRILAERSGVNLRTLQQYEIGSKDLKKASGSTLLALSRELGCSMEELIVRTH